METEKATTPAPIPSEETRATLPLIAVIPSTSVFAGWGPRMNGTFNDVLKSRN
ncbi:MAG: hypothetical protein GIX03_00040 [Candidatus Eremiobacteraeota bacterium]|nr:hypothetical protein [Candidatus Eremiobacteraeota bacterium]MBC5801412.1 hypothetical protein [Candidatus Eremiobacteraeota bacterium]MBC5825526.1 hypothetical protein [Candidatus Eremiobacteraeota bacterium]